MKILFASDHAGYELKNSLVVYLKGEGFDVEDMGAHVLDKDDDYPRILLPLALRIVESTAPICGIVLGKSGQGEAMICNRLPGVRAAVYHGKNLEAIRLTRHDNDANVLSLGAGFVEEEEAKEAVRLFISTPFSGEKRYTRRNDMLDNIE